MSSSREDFLAEGRARWRAALREALGEHPIEKSVWTDLSQMPRVLAPFMGSGVGHTHLPTGGGMDMTGVALGHERGTLEFRAGNRAAYIFAPKQVVIRYFEQAPAQSFVYIEGGTLKPSGVYDQVSTDQEELVEVAPGDYRDRYVWDQGFIDHDEYGDEIPLPRNARLAMRFLRGNFVIVGNGSVWNGLPDTYDGEHDELGEEGMADLIARVIRHLGLSE